MKKIIKILKHTFIPHKHNDFKPGFFREISVGIILFIGIGLFLVSAGTKLYINNTNMTAAVLPAVLVDLTNNTRQLNGEFELVRSSVLDEAARLKAEDMAKFSYFSHTSPNGITPWSWFYKAGYGFIYAGENLAIDFTESVDVENAWLKSPTHKANILNNNFTEIGIATAEGYFNGHPTVYVVQMFGKPIKKTPVKYSEELILPIKEVKKEVVVINSLEPTNSNVKGESIVIDEELETITDTKEFISVKNIDAEEDAVEVVNKDQNNNKKYSTWYQRLIFLTPSYLDNIYKILIYIVFIALVLMAIIEIRRQHLKNIMYGILLIVIILCLIYLNKSIFLIDFLI